MSTNKGRLLSASHVQKLRAIKMGDKNDQDLSWHYLQDVIKSKNTGRRWDKEGNKSVELSCYHRRSLNFYQPDGSNKKKNKKTKTSSSNTALLLTDDLNKNYFRTFHYVSNWEKQFTVHLQPFFHSSSIYTRPVYQQESGNTIRITIQGRWHDILRYTMIL